MIYCFGFLLLPTICSLKCFLGFWISSIGATIFHFHKLLFSSLRRPMLLLLLPLLLLLLLYLFISLFVLSSQPSLWRNNFACFMSLFFFVLSRCQMIGIGVCWVACVSLIFLSYFTRLLVIVKAGWKGFTNGIYFIVRKDQVLRVGWFRTFIKQMECNQAVIVFLVLFMNSPCNIFTIIVF